ncbi:hypothetical protein P5V15_000256 [Pogonomyrmex californicus]
MNLFHRREHLEAQRSSTEKSERSSSIEAKTGPTMIDAKTMMTATTLTVNGKAPVVTTTMTELRTTTVSMNTSPVMSTLSTLTVDTKIENKSGAILDTSVNPPTIVMSSVTPPAISPTAGSNLPLPGTSTSGSSSPVGSPNVNSTPTHPLLSTRRDSTTQVSATYRQVSDRVLFYDKG